MDAARLIRETRLRHGVSQRALALRAGTTQPWISELERGAASPTVEMLARLLQCMGEELVLGTQRMTGHRDHDPVGFRHVQRQTVDERLADGIASVKAAATIGRR